MNLTVITEPAFEPVTLADVYRHLRLDPDDSPATHPDDPALERHITSARKIVELMARRALILQTLRLSMAGFPHLVQCTTLGDRFRRFVSSEPIRLHRPPLVAVDSVRYFDAENVLQTVDPSSYYTTDEQVPELRFTTSFVMPTVYDRPDAVRVQYRAGYPDAGSPEGGSQVDAAANVPAPLKEAILMGVQLLYDDLSPADRTAIENMREATVQPFRVQLSP